MKVLKYILLLLPALTMAAENVFDEDRLLTNQEIQYFNKLSRELEQKTGLTLSAAFFKTASVQIIQERALEKDIFIVVLTDQRRKQVLVSPRAKSLLPQTTLLDLEQKKMIPAFKREKYGQGLLSFAASLCDTIAKQKKIKLDIDLNTLPQEQGMPLKSYLFCFVVFLLLLLCFFKNRKDKIAPNPRGGFSGGFHEKNFEC
ncbi:MAG: TPM domain-containing protein [Fibrobacteraceae bacterium]|mgnify:CR=1 FL=1|nr:TPM domain-containing protein [Fibrobacteraceae bacterium]